MRRRSARPSFPGLVLSGVMALAMVAMAGCSFDDGPTVEASEPAAPRSTTPTEVTSALPVPFGIELTEPGTELGMGEEAVVAYQPRRTEVGVLEIAVGRLERTTFARSFQGWEMSKQDRRSTPYFVRATVTNVGQTDLGGDVVPLYGVDGEDTLLSAAQFATVFQPCPGWRFPRTFKHGEREKVCLVFLSPGEGDLTAVSFRPDPVQAPITWTGEIKRLRPEGSDKGPRDKDRKGARTPQPR